MIKIDEDNCTQNKSIWNRILLFITEFAENQKCIVQLIENLHNVINNCEEIESLHVANSNTHNFYIRNRFEETEQVKIICEYQSPIVNHEKPVMDSFFQSMNKYEKEEEFNPFDEKLNQEKSSQPMMSEEMRNKDVEYSRIRKFTILAPTNISMKKLSKIIDIHLSKRDPLTLSRSGKYSDLDFSL